MWNISLRTTIAIAGRTTLATTQNLEIQIDETNRLIMRVLPFVQVGLGHRRTGEAHLIVEASSWDTAWRAALL